LVGGGHGNPGLKKKKKNNHAVSGGGPSCQNKGKKKIRGCHVKREKGRAKTKFT